MAKTWDDMLNDGAETDGAGAVRDFAFSLDEIKKVPPKNSFERLQRMAEEVSARRDKHSIGGIHRALETEIHQRRNA